MDIAARYEQLAEQNDATRRRVFLKLVGIYVVALAVLAVGLWHLCPLQ